MPCTTSAAAPSTSPLLRKTPVGFAILGKPDGIERLGGIDFDAAIFGHVTSIWARSTRSSTRTTRSP